MCVFLPDAIFNNRCEGTRTSKGPNGSLQAVLEGMKKRSSYDGGEGSGMCAVRSDRIGCSPCGNVLMAGAVENACLRAFVGPFLAVREGPTRSSLIDRAEGKCQF